MRDACLWCVVVAIGATACGGTPETPDASTGHPDADRTFETMHDYVGYFQVRAATDQTAPFDPPAFAISDDPSSGLIGRACASPSASPCDDGPVLFSGATINNGVIQVTTTTNVPTACRDAPTMGSCVAGYNQTFLSLLYGDHPDAEIVQLETCSTPDVAPTCTTPLPPSCPDVDASTLDVVCTKIAVLVGQFTI